MKKILVSALLVYKRIFSPFLKIAFGGGCRFEPTCSEYALSAIQKHGSLKGTWLAAKRFARCHPLAKAALDPLPK